jgi:hypothetical protein
VEKRYQVFVSSTFWDLEKERQEVMHALLELDCIPSGMELFPAANEDQWNLIKKVIDDCDYYVLILAGRYGSIGPDGISYTEMEYRYALSTGKPTIAFIHKDPGNITSKKTEQSPDGKEKLKVFRTEVEKKLCKQWDSPEQLGSVVSRSLVQLIKSTPAIGWVRANEISGRDATMELLQLRRKVEELQSELSQVRTSAPKESQGLAQGEEEHEFHFSFRYDCSDENMIDAEDAFKSSWNEIFSVIAPLMINEGSESTLKSALDRFVEKCNKIKLAEANNSNFYENFRFFKLHQEDFQIIKVQLRALGLIAKSDKNRSVKDSGTYWILTPYGDECMTRLVAIRGNR